MLAKIAPFKHICWLELSRPFARFYFF